MIKMNRKNEDFLEESNMQNRIQYELDWRKMNEKK